MSALGLWVYLSTTPLFWLTVTLVAYLAADRIALACRRHPLVNPVLLAVVVLGTLLSLSGTSYAAYFAGAQFIHFLLGPATVALAVPLYRNRRLVMDNLLPMLGAVLAGSSVATLSAVSIAALLGAKPAILASLAPKSVTTAVAMAIAERLGGLPSLTASLVIITGILGALMVTPMMNALRIKDYAARGFAAGLASHGLGTARAFAVNSVAGAFAGIAMGANAIVTAVLAPLLMRWF